VLVRTTHSVISVGTEKMKIEQARMNLLQKARARPDQVRKVLETARNLGWRSAIEKVRNRLESPTPLGYSAAGIVVHVDSANTRFRVGDRVACAGAECAFHAEYIGLPDLLAAPVPANVENWQAAYTTLCAIALQAVRQTEPQLGDRILVMGQGLVGLIVTNLLQASGARVMAVDVQEWKRAACEAMGAEKAVISSRSNLIDEVRAWTEGYGVDAVIVCTSTQSNSPVEQAAEALRDRGRIVVVGNTKVDLDWKMFYGKEIEVRYSRSYGPGRYDPAYEWGGQEYPIGYIRWSEQRNFQACLQLMAGRRINLEAITTRRVKFSDALGVYQDLAGESARDIGVVLEYEAVEMLPAPSKETSPGAQSFPARSEFRNAVNRVDVIGAGNFARTMLLPHLRGAIEVWDRRKSNHPERQPCQNEVRVSGRGYGYQCRVWRQRSARGVDSNTPSFARASRLKCASSRPSCFCRKAVVPDARRVAANRCRRRAEQWFRAGGIQSPLRTCDDRTSARAWRQRRPQISNVSRHGRQA
jgi:threonine dehydrogenase-like Zn-dependent dehydrogenase